MIFSTVFAISEYLFFFSKRNGFDALSLQFSTPQFSQVTPTIRLSKVSSLKNFNFMILFSFTQMLNYYKNHDHNCGPHGT